MDARNKPATELQEVSKFSQAKSNVSSALLGLNDAINNVYKKFGPVINPTPPDQAETKRGEQPCEFTEFVQSTIDRINDAANELNRMCELSAI